MRGNCYAVSEAAYHILGGKKAGWTPMVIVGRKYGHWFLKHQTGMILDLSVRQFRGKRPNYAKAHGCGFLTKRPSARARKLLQRMTWQTE